MSYGRVGGMETGYPQRGGGVEAGSDRGFILDSAFIV